MKKITYIISDIDRAASFEWIAEGLDKDKFSLSFILLLRGPSYFEGFLERKGIDVYVVPCRSKKEWLQAFIRLYKRLKNTRPDIIHTHFYEANLFGLSAGKLAGVAQRIYTRHYGTYHHIYRKKGVFFDKLFNRWATQIIAISDVVKDVLINWEKVPAEKVVSVPHGIQIEDFENVVEERVTAFRHRHGLTESSFVVGVISRMEELKGVQYIIPSFKKLLLRTPDACLVILNARGVYKSTIVKLLEDVPARNYRLIDFERDIASGYKVFDLFVHVPINEHCEAFGLIYLEALAAGVPSIFTLSGIAPTFIKDEQNALVVPFKDSEAIFRASQKLLTNRALKESIVKNGLKDVKSLFGIDINLKRLEALYSKAFHLPKSISHNDPGISATPNNNKVDLDD